jgi:hypothetical protein
MFLRNVIASVVISCLIAVGAMAQTTITTTTTREFALIGLGSTETAQINVLNLATTSLTGASASCAGTIAFLNTSGATIGTSTSFTLATGQISSAILPFASAGAGLGKVHTVVRGEITLNQTSRVPCRLVSSLEVYDTNSGVTHSTSGVGALATVGPISVRP